VAKVVPDLGDLVADDGAEAFGPVEDLLEIDDVGPRLVELGLQVEP
jgi:hypothetical protein